MYRLNLNNFTINDFNTELNIMEIQLKLDQVYLREKLLKTINF